LGEVNIGTMRFKDLNVSNLELPLHVNLWVIFDEAGICFFIAEATVMKIITVALRSIIVIV